MVSEMDIQHLAMIRASVRQYIKVASLFHKPGHRVLDIAPQDHAGAREFFPEVVTLDLAPGADYQADICNDNSDKIPANSFDTIICTEVLEHVVNPFNAVKELHRMLKPWGRIYVTTPFNFRIHGPLPDNWRFTIHGLRELFKDWKHVEVDEINCDRYLMPIHYRLTAVKL